MRTTRLRWLYQVAQLRSRDLALQPIKIIYLIRVGDRFIVQGRVLYTAEIRCFLFRESKRSKTPVCFPFCSRYISDRDYITHAQ